MQIDNTAQSGLPASGEMPFLDHLEDLRRTIIRMAITLLVSMMLCFGFSGKMMSVLRLPVDRVWNQYEGSRLPSAIDVDDWVDAKSLAAVCMSLPTESARKNLRARHSAAVCELADVVPYLHAADILPEGDREAYLKAAPMTAREREIALSLYENGAELKEGKGREALKLMGAFQPGEAFLLSITLSLICGAIISFPILMYYVLQFIVPGLLENERRMLYKSVAFGFGLFLVGCSFAYFVVLPRILTFFYSYSLDMGIENDWRIGYYISFAAKVVFVFGVIFELPVVVIPFVKLGVLTYERMKRTRGYALVACMVVALFLAPAPDPGTMLIMAMPMYLLYELCIFYAYFHAKSEAKKLAAEQAANQS